MQARECRCHGVKVGCHACEKPPVCRPNPRQRTSGEGVHGDVQAALQAAGQG